MSDVQLFDFKCLVVKGPVIKIDGSGIYYNPRIDQIVLYALGLKFTDDHSSIMFGAITRPAKLRRQGYHLIGVL